MTTLNYIAKWRKGSGLSQYDVAALIGISQSSVSRYEQGERPPPLAVGLGLYIVFGVQPDECYPDLYAELLDHAVAVGLAINTELEGKTDPVSRQKRRTLAAMIKRAKPKPAA